MWEAPQIHEIAQTCLVFPAGRIAHRPYSIRVQAVRRRRSGRARPSCPSKSVRRLALWFLGRRGFARSFGRWLRRLRSRRSRCWRNARPKSFSVSVETPMRSVQSLFESVDRVALPDHDHRQSCYEQRQDNQNDPVHRALLSRRRRLALCRRVCSCGCPAHAGSTRCQRCVPVQHRKLSRYTGP